MRIFILHASALPTDYMPHGDGLLAYRYVTELAARGHEIVLAVEEAAIRGGVPERVRVIDVGARTESDRVTYMRNVRTVFRREHARTPFDLVHQLNPVFLGLSLALTGLRIPRVLGPYVASWPAAGGSRVRGFAVRTLRLLEQMQATHVILAGAQAKSNIAYQRVRQTVIPYGIDTREFAPRPLTPLARPTIIWLGPIAHRKGIVTFIHALAFVRDALPNVLARIAGTGEDFDEMQQTIATYGLEPNVEIMGSVPRAEVPEYLASGHLLCQPSVGEPYGMSIVEAMAIGRPIVATAAGGFLDTVVDGAGGILVPVHARRELADALIRILQDPQLAAEMSAYNVRRAETFAWRHAIDALEAVYADIVCAA